MDKITLNRIIKNDMTIEYDFSYTDGLKDFFSGKPFVITYPESIETVPDAVLSIPFVANILPIIWLTDSELFVDSIDKDFFECIPDVKKGYSNMFPEANWNGRIVANEICDCVRDGVSGSVAFYSGGVDATTTLLLHLKENPCLFVIWGADVDYNNETGWQTMHDGLNSAATQYNLPLSTIHSSFRKFDSEHKLDDKFAVLLKDGWWHGVKHSIGIIAQAAPLMWVCRRNKLYIASTYCAKDQNVRCASYPTIDEAVRFFGCNVFHDGFELNRQGKVNFIVNQNQQVPVSLKVCWESQSGKNCCNCEKCFRTMVGIWTECADPKNYGFDFDDNTIFSTIYSTIAMSYNFKASIGVTTEWVNIQQRFIDNWKNIKKHKYGKQLKWIRKFDFYTPENNKCRRKLTLKQNKGLKAQLSLRFPTIYNIYKKVTHK